MYKGNAKEVMKAGEAQEILEYCIESVNDDIAKKEKLEVIQKDLEKFIKGRELAGEEVVLPVSIAKHLRKMGKPGSALETSSKIENAWINKLLYYVVNLFRYTECKNYFNEADLKTKKEVKKIIDGETYTKWTGFISQVIVLLFFGLAVLFRVFRTEDGGINYDEISGCIAVCSAIIGLVLYLTFFLINKKRKKKYYNGEYEYSIEEFKAVMGEDWISPPQWKDFSLAVITCPFCGEKNIVSAEDKESHKCTRCGNSLAQQQTGQEGKTLSPDEVWRQKHTATLKGATGREAGYFCSLGDDTIDDKEILFLPECAKDGSKIKEINWFGFDDKILEKKKDQIKNLKYIYVPKEIVLTKDIIGKFNNFFNGRTCKIIKFTLENGKIQLQENQEVGNGKK